jgi:hypothetical protein
MSRETPDHHDADLVLRVYDLRREHVLRESRNALNTFWPRSVEEVVGLVKPENSLNTAFRQVVSYWEMVYGMVHHGIVHGEYFLESNGEGLFLFAKVAPYLDQLRADYTPTLLRHTEWVATQCEPGKRLYETVLARVRKRMEAVQNVG